MNPKDLRMLQDWLNSEQNKKHSSAIKYIEENVDLIDTDLQKFMDNCPTFCLLEVYEMMLKADIDMKDYAFKGSLKEWTNYIHDANSQFQPYYTIDYKEEINEYIENMLTWKTDWRYDSIVLDTIPAVEEA